MMISHEACQRTLPANPAPPRRRKTQRWVDAAMFVIVAYLVCYDLMRDWGAAGVLVPVMLAAIITIRQRSFIRPRQYVAFMLWACLIMALSLLGLMPKSWTEHFDRLAAFRQFAPLVMLPFLASAFSVFFTAALPWIERHALRALVVMYALHLLIPMWRGSVDEFYGTFYTITNNTAAFWIVFIFWVTRQETPVIAKLLGIAIMTMLASSAQSLLIVLLLPFMFLWRQRDLALVMLALALAVFLLVAPYHAQTLFDLDPNSGVRAVMWKDVLKVVRDTFGLGVGFGTEYITNFFGEVTDGEWGLASYEDDLFYLASHSTLYDMLLRLGAVGVVLFLLWLWPQLHGADRLKSRADRVAFAVVAAMFLIVNAINVGVFSVNFLFGGATMLGFLNALRLSQPGAHGRGKASLREVQARPGREQTCAS